MSRQLKIYLWSLAVVVVVCLLLGFRGQLGVLQPHHNLANNPASIEKIVDVPLPSICSSESDNNLDRVTSCWDCFVHTAYFSTPLTDKTISRLEQLCQTDSSYWCKSTTEQCYIYTDDAWNSGGAYYINCRIFPDHLYIEYYIDEVMRIVPQIIAAIVTTISAIVMALWGLGLLIYKSN